MFNWFKPHNFFNSWPFQGSTSVVGFLFVACFGDSFYAFSPSSCLDDIQLSIDS